MREEFEGFIEFYEDEVMGQAVDLVGEESDTDAGFMSPFESKMSRRLSSRNARRRSGLRSSNRNKKERNKSAL